MKRVIISSIIFMLFSTALYAGINTKQVSYTAGGVTMKGYLAYDDGIKGKRPGILVVHEWWGHNEYARKRARMLAKLGYTALAVDMYGNGKTASHPEDAGKFSGEVKKNMDSAEARFLAAYDLLQKHRTTQNDKIAAIGYCFGGGIVLEMARRGVDLDGVASFHGSLGSANKAQPGKVRAKLLVLNGVDDPFVKAESISQFKQEMQNAGVDFEFINYPGAKHSFTNPDADKFGEKFNLPLQYNAEADKESWAKLQQFFNKIFK